MPHRKHPQWLKRFYGFFSPFWRHNFFHEQYSTILSPIPWFDGNTEHPQQWRWYQGRLTNSSDKNKEFMYLHFMNWKSSKWLHKQYGVQAAWEGLNQLVHCHNKKPESWSITHKGFFCQE